MAPEISKYNIPGALLVLGLLQLWKKILVVLTTDNSKQALNKIYFFWKAGAYKPRPLIFITSPCSRWIETGLANGRVAAVFVGTARATRVEWVHGSWRGHIPGKVGRRWSLRRLLIGGKGKKKCLNRAKAKLRSVDALTIGL